MCLTNVADLCSYYDECDIEEREALLNRFEEQTEMLAERIAMMSLVTAHLKSGVVVNGDGGDFDFEEKQERESFDEEHVALQKQKIIEFTQRQSANLMEETMGVTP